MPKKLHALSAVFPPPHPLPLPLLQTKKKLHNSWVLVPSPPSPQHCPPKNKTSLSPPFLPPTLSKPKQAAPSLSHHPPCHTQNKTTVARTKQTSKRNVGDKPGRVSLVNLQAKEQQAAQAANANAIRAPLQVKKRRIRNSVIPVSCVGMGALYGSVMSWAAGGRSATSVWWFQRIPFNRSPSLVSPLGVSVVIGRGPDMELLSPTMASIWVMSSVLSKPPAVMGTFQHATTSEVATLSTAIIHLHLDGLTLDPDPVHIIQSMIQGSLGLPMKLQLKCSLPSWPLMEGWFSSSLPTVKNKVGISLPGSRDGQVFVSRVFEVLEALLTPLSKVVEGGDLIFLVCGYLVKHQESFARPQVSHEPPRSMLLFDADRLLPVNTIPFLMSVLDLTIIQGFQQMDKTVKAALKDCGVLGRHSNIILMFWGSQGGRVLVERYIWTDKFIKPWGQNLPAQCPQCGSIQEWLAASADSTYSYQCQYPDCGKDLEGTALPPKTYTISMPQGAKKLLDGKKSSAWLVEIL
ncbi:hypothetical protein F5J12DRAFT_786684 [Pisolithus orientalis]|uniref:uncharacterized protein n=1 Tax=Pisolithus orientalis TaxID=936130 RepID=UPI00222441D4|nr:uncharacterized protein F5J12DRAFT_786684 [Pisolithus orientalis]KAI5989413.1 hypothetical protein F5J12DRAFT_786684 [Pisolithus orientalis]